MNVNCDGIELNIRQAVPGDIERVTKLEALGFPPVEAAENEDFAHRIATFSKSFFVGEVDGEIITFVNGGVTDSKIIFDKMYRHAEEHNEDGDYQAIFGLCTHPEYQRKGLAEVMLNYMITVTKERGKKGLILTCKEYLLHYYEKFGFQSQGVSASTHGGAIWYDMLLEFNKER